MEINFICGKTKKLLKKTYTFQFMIWISESDETKGLSVFTRTPNPRIRITFLCSFVVLPLDLSEYLSFRRDFLQQLYSFKHVACFVVVLQIQTNI